MTQQPMTATQSHLNSTLGNLDGKNVTGTYYGVPFAGTVTRVSWHSINNRAELWIKLDSTIDLPMCQRRADDLIINGLDVERGEHTVTEKRGAL